MVVIGNVTFYKAIVIQVGVFGSEIINEKHFKTLEDAQMFSDSATNSGYVCVVCQM